MDPLMSQHQANAIPFVPLSEDWERHKKRIIQLYFQNSLEEVRAVMREEFCFKASLRMYRYRLKKWDCYKHKSRQTTNQQHASPSEAGSQHMPFESNHTDDNGWFTQDTRITPLEQTGSCEHSVPYHIPVSQERGEDHSMVGETSTSLGAYRYVSREVAFTDTDKRALFSIDALQGLETPFTTMPSLSPTMAITHVGPQLRRLELIFNAIHAQVLSVACMSSLGTRSSHNHTNSSHQVTMSTFWHRMGHGIYFLKAEDAKRAWKLFHKACEAAMTEKPNSKDLISDMLPTINEMLTTLSPINTQVCPDLRGVLLRYLADTFRGSLGREHPATVIACQLQAQDSCPEVYKRASSYLLDMVIAQLGPANPMCFKAQTSLVRTLRKNEDFEHAHTVARQLFEDVHHSLGEDALQTRQAAREISLLLMVEKKWAEALEVCSLIIGQQVEGGERIAPQHRDKCAAYTMEDIAKCYENLGYLDLRDKWLREAYNTGINIPSIDSLVTQHIKRRLQVSRLLSEVPSG
ncbi:hypothetical protein BJ875DRAFT_463896 [Amylocarpus encephaloides]|uniref:Clr5 domain-containing protein n=1 Tax=Amylocarpus encephaloides TaxID=45428 RepID=A0A9P7YHH9_9HELO|nr:hypothetical protein BJ875DRAFT_463896 [Amylocarpus encephaloides]